MNTHHIKSVHFLNLRNLDLSPTGKFECGWPPWRKRTQIEWDLNLRIPHLGFAVECLLDSGRLVYLRPSTHGLSDFGSIPEIARAFISETYALTSFIVHDSGCREHGLWLSSSLVTDFVFVPLSSDCVHHLLRLCVEHERRNRFAAWVIWRAVVRGGPRFDVEPGAAARRMFGEKAY